MTDAPTRAAATAAPLVLHDWELDADAYKARLLLALLGLSCERRPVDVFPGRETDGAAFRALSPTGRLPVLVDGGRVVAGAEAVLVHLAGTAAPGTWLPDDPADRAAVTGWLAFSARDLAAAEAARAEAMLGLPSPIADPVAVARRAFRILEDHLVLAGIEGRGFLVGDRPTVADVACFPAAALAVDFGEAHEDHPKIRAWTRRIRALPGFVAMPGIPEFL